MSNNNTLILLSDSLPPFVPAPREYSGNFCGIRVPGLPPVAGGSSDSSLVFSPFIDRYTAADRERIYAAYRYPDLLLSWPDSRAFGPQQFAVTIREAIARGKRPAVMLLSKDYDPSDFDGCMKNIVPALPYLIGVVPRVCIGWELDAFLSPEVLHALIDALAPPFVTYGCKVYVHFTPGKGAWQENHHQTADFWNAHIGQLTGLFHQRIPGSSVSDYQTGASGCLDDMLVRFAGGDGFSADSGFGHPWDLIALEITASEQFGRGMSEADGDRWGRIALDTPPRGDVHVQGSGNGQ